MASASAACAPCVFGAVSTSLISYPYTVIGTAQVSVIPHITVRNGTSVTLGVETTTILPEVAGTVVGPGGAPIVSISHPTALTWTTLGTTLSYPNIYVEYLGFEGAAVTGTGCAESLSPTPLTLPTDVASASLVYSYTGNSLPMGLLEYLDSQGAIPSQLGGDQLITCSPVGPAPVASPTTSQPSSTVVAPTSTTSSTSTSALTTTSTSSTSLSPTSTITESNTTTTETLSTSYSTFTSTIATATTTLTSISIPPSTASTLPLSSAPAPSPTSTTVTSIVQTTSPIIVSASTVSATKTLTIQPALVFNTNTGQAIIVQSSSSTTVILSTSAPTALAATISTSSSPTVATLLSSSAAGTLDSSGFGALFSALASEASSVVTASRTSSSSSSTTSSSSATTPTTVPYAYINSTEGSSFLVGPVTGSLSGTPYSVVNATSTTYAVLNGTSTTYIVPYTGAAQKGARPAGLGWVECVLGLALPALL